MDRAELIKELDELAEMTPPICLWDSPETVEVGGGKVTVYCKPFEQFQSLVKQAADALREKEQSKWISVKEERPKRMKRYFIAYEFEGSDMRFYGEAMFHPEGGNGCVDRPHFSNEGVDGMYVTHWMEIPKLPLPEPPEGGAQE